MAFLLAELAAVLQGRNNDLAERKVSLHGYYSIAVVKVQDLISVKFSTDRSELKIVVVQKAMSMIISGIEKIHL